jgi:hypothetical protein
LSACALSFPREEAVSAVSDPEKNAESITSKMMAAAVIQRVRSRAPVTAELVSKVAGFRCKR